MFDDGFKNFMATVDINFSLLGSEGYYRLLQGIGRHYDFLVSAKPALDAYRAKDTPTYDFKFLEIFTSAEMLDACLDTAESRLSGVQKTAFGT